MGYATGDDAVVIRGDLGKREFIAFYHRDGVVTAAMNVNIWDVVEDLRAIITAGKPIDAGAAGRPQRAAFRTGVLAAGRGSPDCGFEQRGEITVE